MKNVILILILILGCTSMGFSQLSEAYPISDDNGRPVAYGFFIDDASFITVYLENQSQLNITIEDGLQIAASRWFYDRNRNFAVYQISDAAIQKNILPPSTTAYRFGEPWMVGLDPYQPAAINIRLIQSRPYFNAYRFPCFLINVKLSPAINGSPVLNQQKEVVGMLFSDTQTSLVIPIQIILEQLPDPQMDPTPPEIEIQTESINDADSTENPTEELADPDSINAIPPSDTASNSAMLNPMETSSEEDMEPEASEMENPTKQSEEDEDTNTTQVTLGEPIYYEPKALAEEERGFIEVTAMDIDSHASIFVLDKKSQRVIKYNRQGNFLNTYPKMGQESEMLKAPVDLVCADNNHVYVLDPGYPGMHIFNNDLEHISSKTFLEMVIDPNDIRSRRNRALISQSFNPYRITASNNRIYLLNEDRTLYSIDYDLSMKGLLPYFRNGDSIAMNTADALFFLSNHNLCFFNGNTHQLSMVDLLGEAKTTFPPEPEYITLMTTYDDLFVGMDSESGQSIFYSIVNGSLAKQKYIPMLQSRGFPSSLCYNPHQETIVSYNNDASIYIYDPNGFLLKRIANYGSGNAQTDMHSPNDFSVFENETWISDIQGNIHRFQTVDTGIQTEYVTQNLPNQSMIITMTPLSNQEAIAITLPALNVVKMDSTRNAQVLFSIKDHVPEITSPKKILYFQNAYWIMDEHKSYIYKLAPSGELLERNTLVERGDLLDFTIQTTGDGLSKLYALTQEGIIYQAIIEEDTSTFLIPLHNIPGDFRHIAVHTSGIVALSDTRYHRIVLLDAEGAPIYVEGTQGNSTHNFYQPTRIEFIQDTVWVLDSGNFRVIAYPMILNQADENTEETE